MKNRGARRATTKLNPIGAIRRRNYLPDDFSDSKSGPTRYFERLDRAPLILRYPPPDAEPGCAPSSFAVKRRRFVVSRLRIASPVVFLKKYNRPHRFLSFFFPFFCVFLSLFVSRFCVSSSSPRSICEVDDTAAPRRTGRRVDFRARRRRSLLSNIRGRAPCRVAGSPSPGERRPGAAETGKVVRGCARRDRFADTSYRKLAIVLGSHPRLSVFIRAPNHLREK